MPVDRRRDSYRRMPEQRGHDLEGDAVAQPSCRRTVTEPVGIERDPGPGPDPQDEVIGRLIRPRVSLRLRPDVDEDMVAVDAAVLLVQVVGTEPDQLRPDRDRPASGLGPGTVRVLPRHDADFPLGGGDVFMTEPEGLASPAAAVIKQGEEEAVPQPGAGVQDRLRLGNGEDPGQLPRGLQRYGPPAIRLPLAHMVQERLPPAPPPRLPFGQQV